MHRSTKAVTGLLSPRPRYEVSHQTRTEVSRPGRPTILVVDDTADNLLLLSNLFKGEYYIRVANCGEKALSICQSDHPPDLVLLDIMMPDMLGSDVAAALHEDSVLGPMHVVFVTSMLKKGEDRKSAKGTGVQTIFAKPISKVDIVQIIKQSLG